MSFRTVDLAEYKRFFWTRILLDQKWIILNKSYTLVNEKIVVVRNRGYLCVIGI